MTSLLSVERIGTAIISSTVESAGCIAPDEVAGLHVLRGAI